MAYVEFEDQGLRGALVPDDPGMIATQAEGKRRALKHGGARWAPQLELEHEPISAARPHIRRARCPESLSTTVSWPFIAIVG